MTIKNIGIDDNGGKLPIREFKLEDMADNSAIVIVAKRGSGKSYLCRKILKQYSKIPVGIVIAKTERMNTFYGNFFPDTYIYYDYKNDILADLLRRQEKMIQKRKDKAKIGKKVDSRGYVIMDDCLADRKSWVREQEILELLLNGRHYDLMYILTMQAPLGIPPELRKQFDYIFLFAEEYINELRKIHIHYAGMFPTFDAFHQVFKQLTQKFTCMVLVNTPRHKKELNVTNTFLDKIFHYKADNVDIGKIGCEQFRMYHEKNYNKDWKNKKVTFNMDEFCMKKKKNKESIEINKLKDTDDRTRTTQNNVFAPQSAYQRTPYKKY